MSTDMISEEIAAGRLGDGLRIDSGVHVWTFTEVDGGVLVRTEENWTGAQVEADVPTSTAFLGAGLEGWLRDWNPPDPSRHDGRARFRSPSHLLWYPRLSARAGRVIVQRRSRPFRTVWRRAVRRADRVDVDAAENVGETRARISRCRCRR
ncbi:hypothetical protein [Nocardia amikacinitolerans]|uniref:hypothetical protein n=1 Tax=Nocardia amikacinitolerans TaxID=756689 RepID=UPI0020A3718F|nr:hypothetical protein [Nocardia amikacinitolerans]